MSMNSVIKMHISDVVNTIVLEVLKNNDNDEKKGVEVIKEMSTPVLMDKLFYNLSSYVERKYWPDLDDALADKFLYTFIPETAEENVRQLKLMIMNTITIISLF